MIKLLSILLIAPIFLFGQTVVIDHGPNKPDDFRMIHDDPLQMLEINTFQFTKNSGKFPAQPAIDFGLDGIVEWGGSDSRVGSWGWQDRFQNGEDIISVNPGISGSASTKAWMESP